jgi:hypothetical protein
MQKVDEYRRLARKALEDASAATQGSLKKTLERLAAEWTLLAQERLDVLELRLKRGKIEE